MLQLVIFLCLAVVFVYIVFNSVKFVINSRIHLKKVEIVPTNRKPHPIWGHLDQFPGPGQVGLDFMYERIKESKGNGIGRVHYGPFFVSVMLHHFKTAKTILKTSEPKPRARLGGYRLLLPWLGDGLLISEGQKWSRNRRLLTPAFHFDILKPYMAINNKCTDIFIDKISEINKNEDYFEVFNHISLLTLDIILKCAFSYDIQCQTMGHQHPYVQAVTELAEGMVHRVLRPWLYANWIYFLTPRGRKFKKNCDYVHKVAEDIIKTRKDAFKEHGDSIMRHHKYIDFLDILLKAQDSDGEGLSDLEIRDEVDTFLFEGHDTTASGISWTLNSLAENPKIQAKCQKEIDAVLEGRDSDNILWEDLNKLPYLTMCIKEALRQHTTVPLIQRILTKDLKIDGYLIPKNTMVEVNIYLLHMNPFIWPEPLEYRPERFSPENLEKQDPYQYVPFSAGPRNCIGQNFAMHEMKVVIARILRRFTLEIDPQRKVRHEIKTVMKTEDGMYLKATPRSF